MNNTIESFEEYINQLWFESLSSEEMINLMKEDSFKDKRLIAIYLTQVYHYAVHTPRHQATVGVNNLNTNFKYMQYCFEHAYEETGHELMALKDINSLGYEITKNTMPQD